METRKIKVSFVVTADGKVSSRDIVLDWIDCDSAETVADDIKKAIENIE